MDWDRFIANTILSGSPTFCRSYSILFELPYHSVFCIYTMEKEMVCSKEKQQKNAIVVGGAGFVGRYFCRALADKDYNVICVDNLSSSSAKHPELWPAHQECDVSFINQDCRKFFKAENFWDQKYEIIIHLAAVIEGRNVIENNPLLVANDLSIDAEFFSWLTKLSIKPGKVVYFSSSAAYPIGFQTGKIFGGKKRLSEDMVNFRRDLGMPDMTYGWAKLTGEYLARLAHEKHGINIVCYRPFSGYGGDQGDAYPFVSIMKRVLAKQNPIEIWSDSTRDFVHIEDVVDCVFSTMGKIEDGSAINIGTGVATSFKGLVRKICQETGHKAKVKILPNRPKGVVYRVANINYCDKLGWKAKISLEDGIKLSIALLVLPNEVLTTRDGHLG